MTDKIFSLSEVAKTLGVNPSKIRFWKDKFGVSPVKGKNHLFFTAEDITQFQLIKHLREDRKLGIDATKRAMKDGSKGKNRIEVIEVLEDMKQFLTQLKKNIDD